MSKYHVKNGMWLGEQIILASKSAGRAALLQAVGIPFLAVDAGIDERSVEDRLSASPQELAQALSIEKARAVSLSHPNRFVLGADQVLAIGADVLHKANSQTEAIAQLRRLRGREHSLHSGVAVVQNGDVSFDHVSTASVTMRDFSNAVLETYVAAMGERLLRTVGCYEIEGTGLALIERIEGDFFTIVGLPLLAILAHFRALGLMAM